MRVWGTTSFAISRRTHFRERMREKCMEAPALDKTSEKGRRPSCIHLRLSFSRKREVSADMKTPRFQKKRGVSSAQWYGCILLQAHHANEVNFFSFQNPAKLGLANWQERIAPIRSRALALHSSAALPLSSLLHSPAESGGSRCPPFRAAGNILWFCLMVK